MRRLQLIITSLLWQQSIATTCNSAFSIPGHVLLDHVIQSFTATSSTESCFDKCATNSSCHSINWYSNTGLCQLNKGTHLSYPEGLVASESSASYLLYSLHPMATCSNRFCSDADICLMNNDGINYRCENNCSADLGMEDGRILNSQITASSFHSAGHEPWKARLHKDGARPWVAYSPALGEWVQVDLHKFHIISKVATQGRAAVHLNQWITKYYLTYSQDGVSWESYQYGSNVKEFKGNTDMTTVVTRKLPRSIKTRLIRVVVADWHSWPTMRIELYGCLAP